MLATGPIDAVRAGEPLQQRFLHLLGAHGLGEGASIGVGPFLAALVAVPVGLVTAVLGSRVMVLALSGVFSSRRCREVAGVVLMLVVSAGGLIPQFFVGSRPERCAIAAVTRVNSSECSAGSSCRPSSCS